MPTNSKEVASWHIDDIEHLSPETAKFYLDEAKEELNSIENFHNNLTKRGYVVLQILITLSVIMVGFFGTRAVEGTIDLNVLTVSALISLVFVILSGYFTVLTISSYNVYAVGQEPKNLALPNYNAVNDPNEQYVEVLAASLDEYQRRIDFNASSYEIRVKRFDKGFWILVSLTPVVFPILLTFLLSAF